jgi:hypothetical protein
MDLRVAHPHARLPRRVQAILQRALALRDRRARLSAHGVAVVRGRLVAKFLRALDHPGRAPALQRFAAHLRTETPAIMSFLFDASLDATNWRAEQALRPAVVNRKVSGGNRSARGDAADPDQRRPYRQPASAQTERRAGRSPADSLPDDRTGATAAPPR